MDAKITKLRLSRMLSYDWLKIVFATAAAIVVWLLVFSIAGTGIMPSQKFTVMNYVGNESLDQGEFNKMHNAAFDKKDGDVFSYEVIERSVEDLARNSNMAGELLQARTAIEEGDVIFVADEYDYRDITDADMDGTISEQELGRTYLENFVSGYYLYLYDINVYLSEMREFVGQYYENGDYKNATLNEEKVKNDFYARAKKDKRFRKSSARAQGALDEVERIQKYRNALVKFEWYLNEGVVSLSETVIKSDYYGEDWERRGVYSINLCPDLDKGGVHVDGKSPMSKLANAVAYRPLEGDGETGYKYGETLTATNMNVCLFRFDGVAKSFEYESLSYIVYIIDRYCHEEIKKNCPEDTYA